MDLQGHKSSLTVAKQPTTYTVRQLSFIRLFLNKRIRTSDKLNCCLTNSYLLRWKRRTRVSAYYTGVLWPERWGTLAWLPQKGRFYTFSMNTTLWKFTCSRMGLHIIDCGAKVSKIGEGHETLAPALKYRYMFVCFFKILNLSRLIHLRRTFSIEKSDNRI